MADEARKKTLYTVLWLDPDAGWIQLGSTEAHSAQKAVETIALARVDTEQTHDGKYVAVPSSSWNPIKIKLETQTVVKVGG